jgi:hypothetical protein
MKDEKQTQNQAQNNPPAHTTPACMGDEREFLSAGEVLRVYKRVKGGWI